MSTSRSRLLTGILLLSLCRSARRRRTRPGTPTALPNIVLMFPDNLGIGEIGVYGGNRGVPTPGWTPSRERECG